MKHLFVLLLVAFPLLVSGQYGVSLKYGHLKSEFWENVFAQAEGGNFAQDLGSVSAFYWFRLKNTRIEFLPEVVYTRSFGRNKTGISASHQIFSALLNVDIYPFDLISDCDCPTFSKQGGFIQKSFFVELTGGIDFWELQTKQEFIGGQILEVTDQSPRFGAGIGLDFGISDLLTITPVFHIHYHGGKDWEGTTELLDVNPGKLQKSGTITGLTIRAIFRPDYTRRYQ